MRKLGLAVGLSALVSTAVAADVPSLDERVAAQRAIEEVYWKHRIWPESNPTPKPPLSEVMPDEAILIRCFDSARSGAARFSAHGAFDDPNTPEDAPPRESIETRALVFFAEGERGRVTSL